MIASNRIFIDETENKVPTNFIMNNHYVIFYNYKNIWFSDITLSDYKI
jgi:hypothetical protein